MTGAVNQTSFVKHIYVSVIYSLKQLLVISIYFSASAALARMVCFQRKESAPKYRIYSAMRQDFPLSRMTTND